MMIPKGLVSAVLASMPEQANLAAGRVIIPGATLIKHVTYAVIFSSIIYCSLLVLITSKQLVKGQEELKVES
jgi:NhaP-type Na+/H+ or K+/H+ antiporter